MVVELGPRQTKHMANNRNRLRSPWGLASVMPEHLGGGKVDTCNSCDGVSDIPCKKLCVLVDSYVMLHCKMLCYIYELRYEMQVSGGALGSPQAPLATQPENIALH